MYLHYPLGGSTLFHWSHLNPRPLNQLVEQAVQNVQLWQKLAAGKS